MAHALLTPLEFDAATHVYRLSGVVVPSVTQVLRLTGYIDLSGVPAAILEQARDRGQRVHEALHFLFDEDLDDDSIDDEVQGYLLSARRYLDAHVRKVLRSEFKVWSVRHGYAGTTDLLAIHDDGIVSVDDFKTGAPDDVAADLQTAAYLGAALEMAATELDLASALSAGIGRRLHRRSIRLFRDGREASETLYPDHRDFAAFIGALSVVHHQEHRHAPLAWDSER